MTNFLLSIMIVLSLIFLANKIIEDYKSKKRKKDLLNSIRKTMKKIQK